MSKQSAKDSCATTVMALKHCNRHTWACGMCVCSLAQDCNVVTHLIGFELTPPPLQVQCHNPCPDTPHMWADTMSVKEKYEPIDCFSGLLVQVSDRRNIKLRKHVHSFIFPFGRNWFCPNFTLTAVKHSVCVSSGVTSSLGRGELWPFSY